jgi:threonine dehydrogenase-like Zn-dependent dehydrogenase
MKAVAVWPERRRIGVKDRPEPVMPSPTSVRPRMLEVGICGTDTETCRFVGEPV